MVISIVCITIQLIIRHFCTHFKCQTILFNPYIRLSGATTPDQI